MKAWLDGQDAANLGKYDEARERFELARSLAPDLPGPWRALGRVARAQGRWEDCVRFCSEALRL